MTTKQTGWGSRLGWICTSVILLEAVTGLAVTLAPFHAAVAWGLLIHTAIGLATLVPFLWYLAIHWIDYRSYSLSHVVLLGYLALIAALLCLVSGLVVTWQGFLATGTSLGWRRVHLITTIVVLATVLPHMVLVYVRLQRTDRGLARKFVLQALVGPVAAVLVAVLLASAYSGTKYSNTFPDDYVYVYGEDRAFAPSLARTTTGGAFDPRSLAGSESCGTSGCHEQIVAEWKPSAHRFAAMDPAFQKIQSVMAAQNGAESTRYCGGCHDPISLFSGTKNVMVENLTGQLGYHEGVSCLSCHSIRETDLQGNANYVMAQPREYLWQWAESGSRRMMRDFLIRTWPAEHNKLSKRMFKTPEFCAACHKQFIDEEVNRVGWVQLQNQYDNWAASHWNQEGDPTKTVECRECHMPLVASTDPAAGDVADYNRHAADGKHRSHRFIASNAMIPALLELEDWERQVELTTAWLQGRFEIPEIADKWTTGPIVDMVLDVPETVTPGEDFSVRVVLTANKVGHDFPTGPLDIIQSWVELAVTAPDGTVIFATGRRDENNFIEPGSFLFKVEPVDQYGNLIDRHNLWEMVGVRFRRALFPGYSDNVEFVVGCPSTLPMSGEPDPNADAKSREYRVDARDSSIGVEYRIDAKLHYRKFDQFLLNYMFGEDSGLTAPVVELARATATVQVVPPVAHLEPPAGNRGAGG